MNNIRIQVAISVTNGDKTTRIEIPANTYVQAYNVRKTFREIYRSLKRAAK